MEINNLLDSPNHFFPATLASVVAQITKTPGSGGPIFGQYSIVHSDADFIWLIRDRLGLNKLFYYLDPERREVTVGNSIHVLASATNAFNLVRSVPPGHYLKIDRETLHAELVCYDDLSRTTPDAESEFDLAGFHRRVDRCLADWFADLAACHPDATFAVCLSGGLDSTVIATYAKRFLKNVFAATFSYSLNGVVSEDFAAAQEIAGALELEFFPIVKERLFDEGRLEAVLRHGQDWRDFNVHCAWLNDQVGEALRVRQPAGELIVLTGDLMNEYVADYTPVTYRDTVYYPQPRISRDRLRRFFIYGLDTSDRELGVFHRHGLTALQPYAALAEEYLRVPASIIEQLNGKELLNLPLIGDPAVQQLVGRAKTRAQVGGKDGGTLGLFHDHGITQRVLKEHWDRMFAPYCGGAKPEEIIVTGRYRS